MVVMVIQTLVKHESSQPNSHSIALSYFPSHSLFTPHLCLPLINHQCKSPTLSCDLINCSRQGQGNVKVACPPALQAFGTPTPAPTTLWLKSAG